MISIVIPVHNEQETISTLYSRLNAVIDRLGEDCEVIVVDDGSCDGTLSRLDELSRQEIGRWNVVALSRNFGHQAAVSAGLHHATGDVVCIMDGDLQDPPEVIPDLIARWREGFQVVYAVRRNRKESFVKRAAYSAFYRVLQKLAEIPVPLDAGDFCVMDRCVVDVIVQLPEKSRFVRGLRSWAGFRQTGLEYERHARDSGESKYSLTQLVHLALDGLLGFSSVPLKLASFIGILLCGGAVALASILFAWALSDARLFGMHPRDAVGWSSIVCIMLLLTGLQMLLTGIVGEYLARVFEEVKSRPAWVVGRLIGFEGQDGGKTALHESLGSQVELPVRTPELSRQETTPAMDS